MESCNSEVNIWYLDDATVCGDPDTVLGDLRKIAAASDTLGLSVNSKKCEIFTIHGSAGSNGDPHTVGQSPTVPRRSSLHPSTVSVVEQIKQDMPRIKILQRDSLELLGAPILEEAASGILLGKLDELKRMIDRLDFIDSHDATGVYRKDVLLAAAFSRLHHG